MLVVGLTGSIGMGKSTVAARLRDLSIPVFDADAEVHALYRGAAAARIDEAFPGTVIDGVVDRVRLAKALSTDGAAFKRLEAIVHPLVWMAEKKFLHAAHEAGAAIAVLEIPLLFEAGSETKTDAVIVVSASAEAQRRRVLQRPGMTPERLEALLARQIPDVEKRRRADFIINTDAAMEANFAAIDAIVAALRNRPARAFSRYWN